MDENEYLERNRSFRKDQGKEANMLHCVLGLTSESGELASAFKKKYGYGRDLDEINVIEELGDLYFFLTWLLDELGVTKETLRKSNINKLVVRNSGKTLDESRVLDRDVNAERSALAEK